MARHSKEYNDGYQAAIEAIKKHLEGSGGGSDDGSSGDGLDQMPNDMISPAEATGKPNSSNSGGQSSNGGGSGSRTDSNDPNQGVVRPEDCASPPGLGNTPGTAGGMISQSDGDNIIEKEGYEKEGGNEASTEREWKDAALKNINKLPKNAGTDAGDLKSKIEALYKVTSDWKKELKKVVGHSISPDEKRSAYANKNILISQDRIARTDKDKYDNVDYMMAWIDSSGSMSDDQLRQCLSEVYSVALAKKPLKLVVIQCDTKIQDIKEYTNLQQLKKDMVKATVKGRGGTELKPCWDLLIKDPKYKRRPAELVMVFTDGYLTQYKRNPRTMRNLCWVILDNPSWTLGNKDIATKVVHIRTSDIK